MSTVRVNLGPRSYDIAIGRGLTTAEVLWHCLKIDSGGQQKGSSMRVAAALKELGFEGAAQETHEGVRDRYYKIGQPRLSQLVGQLSKGK